MTNTPFTSYRQSAVDTGDPWAILANAQIHLADGMDSSASADFPCIPGDVQAWLVLAELKDSFFAG